MSETTYRVEPVLLDPRTGAPLMMRQRGTPYATLPAATRAAARMGEHWIIIAERIVAGSAAVEAAHAAQDAA